MGLSRYEQQELAKVRAHRQKELSRSPRNLVPESVRSSLKGTGEKLRDRAGRLPGADKVKDVGGGAFKTAAEGAGKFMTKTGQLTTSETRVIRAYDKRGHSVTELDDIRALDLRAIDRVASFVRLQYTYSLAAAAEGAATGLAVTGGEAAGVAGAGAAAAPGLGVIAAATGTDIAALLTLCSRVVAHYALYYGYDPRTPAEEVFMMQVIGHGLAGAGTAKTVAYQQLTKLTRSLATNASWQQLNQHALVKVTQKFAERAGQRLTKKKLGQFVPVAGVAIGAGMNFKMVDDVAASAYWAYRERFLFDKDPEAVGVGGDGWDTVSGDGEFETPIDVVEILESEGIGVDEEDKCDRGVPAELSD